MISNDRTAVYILAVPKFPSTSYYNDIRFYVIGRRISAVN